MTKFKQQCLRGTEIMEINYEKPDAGEAPRLTKIKKKKKKILKVLVYEIFSFNHNFLTQSDPPLHEL